MTSSVTIVTANFLKLTTDGVEESTYGVQLYSIAHCGSLLIALFQRDAKVLATVG
jgi:hypothetical protein